MPWHRPGDKSVSEPLMVSLLKHICVTQPQWVKATIIKSHLVNSITVTNVKLCVQTQLSSGIISESVKLYVQTCHVLIVSIMCWYQQVMSDYFHIWHALCYTNKSGLSDSSYDNRGWHHRLRDKLLVFFLDVPLVGGLGTRTVTTITWIQLEKSHYCDIIMSMMTSQITRVSIVYSTVCSGAEQRKYQSSMTLALLIGNHWWLVDSPHKGPVTQKMFPFSDVIMLGISMLILYRNVI